MVKKVLLLVVLFFQATYALANISVDIDTGRTYNPIKGEKAAINIKSPSAGIASISMLSPDGFVIKHLGDVKVKKNRNTAVFWDGRDFDGDIVPDEAYFPYIKFVRSNGSVETVNTWATSGGEYMKNIPVFVNDKDNLSLMLNEPSRLLIRAGLKKGAMLDSIVSWKAFPKGALKIKWNGKDNANRKITMLEGFSVFATGYRLPKNAIVIKATEKSYPKFCLKDRPKLLSTPLDIESRRAGESFLSSRYRESKCFPAEPVPIIIPSIVDDASTNSKRLKVKIDMPKEYLTLVEQDLYEVSIYIDDKFVAEKEQGYVPFFWSTDLKGYAHRDHVVTVNIVGFMGQVGTASAIFSLDKGK